MTTEQRAEHPSPAGAERVAEEVLDRIRHSLVELAQEDGARVHVVVRGRTAWLSGSVSSLEVRRRAAYAALSTAGVDDVHNNLEIR